MPEGNWTQATNIAHYHVFASQAEADGWYDTWSTNVGVKAGLGGPRVPSDDPRYALVEKKLSVVWRAFTELLPRDTAGLAEPPRVILVDRTDVNAVAMAAVSL